MKQIVLGLFFSVVCIGLPAQRFVLDDPVETPIIVDLEEETFAQVEFQLVNPTSDTLFLQINASESRLADGHRSNFCASGKCVDTKKAQPLILLPETAFTYHIQTEKTQDSQHEYFFLDLRNTAGESEVNLVFEDLRSGEVQHAQVLFAVNGKSEIEAPKTTSFSAPYPNPADRVAYLDFTLPENITNSYLRVVNLIGREVQRVDLERKFGTATILTDKLPSGVYFVYLIGDNEELGTRKMVVSK